MSEQEMTKADNRQRYIELGYNIAYYRKHAGLTQEQLAEKLILTAESISRIENGKGMCMPEHIVHICELLNITSDYLYFGNNCANDAKNEMLSNINKILSECDVDEVKRIEHMILLFMRK